MYFFTTYKSPIGLLTLASNENEKLVGLWIEAQKYHGDTIFANMTKKDNLPVFEKTKEWLDRYFKGKRPNQNELPLAPVGSDFRQKVWHILRSIPYGQTITYGDIGKQLAAKSDKKISNQAVGGAVGHNPIAIIIPCHRVVGAHKNLTGFAAGIETKIKLLQLEGIDTTQFIAPTKASL